MGLNLLFDMGNALKAVGLQAQSGVAAGTGDNTEVTSSGIDRKPEGLADYDAMLLVVGFKTTLGSSETLKLTVKISDSADNSSWSSDTTMISAETQATGVATNSVGQRELGIDLRPYKRYVRFKITMDLSASGTDVFVWSALAILAASNRLPI